MVVVLIIGILLSVGIPTFVGARTRGQDVAARSTLYAAATAATVLSDFGADYSRASAGALAVFEPSLTYVEGTVASTGPNEVSVDSSTAGEWTATARSASGTCFGIELTPSSRTFFKSSACGTDSSGPPVPATPTNLALTSAVAAGSGTTAQNVADGDYSTRGGTLWNQGKWFSFDLGSVSQISQILLYNRTDSCCSGRTRDITIYISNDPIPGNASAAQSSGAQSFFLQGIIGQPTTLTVNTTGRYVMVFGSGPATAFQEIEIMGVPS